MDIDERTEAAWLLDEIGQDKTFSEKYRIERELGSGAFGIVVCAHHRELDERVAIKFLRPQRNSEAAKRFIQEARAAHRVKDQHVVRIHDASTTVTGIPYIVMEYLEGIDLEHLLLQSPHRQLPIADAIEFILQTCEALAECHHRWGIVHRDLKPSNLFCVQGSDGLPMIKVLDFGISKLGAATMGMASTEPSEAPARILGSPPYMSPEQFESSTNVDARTDIWSIGVVLYEFVTGRLPFSGNTLLAIREAIRSREPTPVRQLRREAPAALASVILKCLEKEPADRYANVAELAKALLPVAVERSRHAITRIVRTVEAPGSDTHSLALPHSQRPSTPSEAPAGRTRRLPLVIAAGVALTLGGFAWRARHPARDPSASIQPALPSAIPVPAPPIRPATGPEGTTAAATTSSAVAPLTTRAPASTRVRGPVRGDPPLALPTRPTASAAERTIPTSHMSMAAADPPPSIATDAAKPAAPDPAPTPKVAPSTAASAGPAWIVDVVNRRKRTP